MKFNPAKVKLPPEPKRDTRGILRLHSPLWLANRDGRDWRERRRLARRDARARRFFPWLLVALFIALIRLALFLAGQ